jgi:hypothetical protein
MYLSIILYEFITFLKQKASCKFPRRTNDKVAIDIPKAVNHFCKNEKDAFSAVTVFRGKRRLIGS